MLGMLKRHEVEILLKAGHRKTEVARLTGVSLCSVKRIAEEAPVVLSTFPVRDLLAVERPIRCGCRRCGQARSFVVAWLLLWSGKCLRLVAESREMIRVVGMWWLIDLGASHAIFWNARLFLPHSEAGSEDHHGANDKRRPRRSDFKKFCTLCRASAVGGLAES